MGFGGHQEDFFVGKLVRLTAPRPEDAAMIARWSSDTTYQMRVDSDLAVPRTPPELERASARTGNLIDLRVRTIADDTFVGFAALFNIEWNNRSSHMAIGIGDRANRRKGYGAEALHLLLKFAFCEANLERVGLDVISYNEDAIRLYQRAGFVREGAMRRSVLRNGQYHDRVVMGILRDEWLQRLGTTQR